MLQRSSKSRDPNVVAHSVLARFPGEQPANDGKDPAAVSLGRRGGLKGGPARAKRLSAAKRSSIARKAARTRWKAAKRKPQTSPKAAP